MDKMPIGTAELQADLTDSLVQNCYDHAVHNNNTQSDRCCRDIRRDEKNKQWNYAQYYNQIQTLSFADH